MIEILQYFFKSYIKQQCVQVSVEEVLIQQQSNKIYLKELSREGGMVIENCWIQRS